jgi:hypothetical protein
MQYILIGWSSCTVRLTIPYRRLNGSDWVYICELNHHIDRKTPKLDTNGTRDKSLFVDTYALMFSLAFVAFISTSGDKKKHFITPLFSTKSSFQHKVSPQLLFNLFEWFFSCFISHSISELSLKLECPSRPRRQFRIFLNCLSSGPNERTTAAKPCCSPLVGAIS